MFLIMVMDMLDVIVFTLIDVMVVVVVAVAVAFDAIVLLLSCLVWLIR